MAVLGELTALERMGTARDIADAARFPIGDGATFISGKVRTVSKGYRL